MCFTRIYWRGLLQVDFISSSDKMLFQETRRRISPKLAKNNLAKRLLQVHRVRFTKLSWASASIRYCYSSHIHLRQSLPMLVSVDSSMLCWRRNVALVAPIWFSE
jgi:hypothetical protein